MTNWKLAAPSALSILFALALTPSAHAQEATSAKASADTTDSDPIVVVGQRAAQRRGVEIQRNADNFVRALSGDDAGKLPDQNVAESVRRLPGISVANDQGEGRYVIIRGVNPQLANVTVNGQTAAAPEPESRQVKLDDIPAALIGSVVLTESLTPEHDANAIAGEVNINTVTAFDRSKSFFELRGAYGQTDLNDEHAYEGDFTGGARFGDFGLVAAANFSHRPITSENVQGSSNWHAVNGFIVPDDFRPRLYNLTRERTGFVLNFDWRPSDQLQLYVRNTYSKFTDDETRDQVRIQIPNSLTNQTATSGTIAGTRATRFVRRREEDDNTYNFTFGGRYAMGESELRGELGYTRAEKTDPLRSEFQFRTGSSSVAATYDLTGDPYVVTATNAAINTPSAFSFNQVNYEHRQAVETLYQGRVDYETPLSMGDQSTLQFGAKITDREKTNNRDVRVYTGGAGFTLANATGPNGGATFDGRYPIGPRVDYNLANAFVQNNPGLFTLSQASSVPNSLANDYEAKETITAAYGMATVHFGQLTVIPGVRVEHTDADYKAKAFTPTSSFNQVYNVFGSQSYTAWFPGVNVRYDVNDDLVLRAAVTRAIGRPLYYGDAPGLIPTVNVDAGAGTVAIGNADLKPFYSTNLDLGVEFYPADGAILSASVFYKDIDNPIYTFGSSAPGTTVFAGQTFAGNWAVSTSGNAKSATLSGVELNAQYQFTQLPGIFSGFGIGLNYTWTDGHAEGVPRPGGVIDNDVPLYFQSPEVGTLQVFYEKYGFTGRLAYSYRAPYLDTVGATTALDQYTDANGQFDARGAYDVTDNVQVFLEGTNLNDTTWRRYIGDRHQLVEEERYSWAMRGGVTLKF